MIQKKKEKVKIQNSLNKWVEDIFNLQKKYKNQSPKKDYLNYRIKMLIIPIKSSILLN